MSGGAGTPGDGSGAATTTGVYAHADYAPGTVLAKRFRIEALLGVGGMGVVYRATDLTLEVPVALKLLRPELARRDDAFERFRQELLLARQVSSAHVVRIHDLVRHEGHWLISMDYVDGESLDRRLDRDGPFAVDDALRIARQLAAGLIAAHAKGVVHRDLKPANILLDAQGDAYISDFGVARSLATSGLTQSGAVVGTPDYLAPEQARGEPVDARSDLYALGLILYEMLAGKLPFAGGTVSEVLAQRMLRTPRPVSEVRAEVPAWVARLVDKLLRPQPAHRFQDAAAVATAIDRREVPRDSLMQRLRTRRTGWLAAAALLVVALVAGGWWWQQREAEQAALAVSPPLQRLLLMPLETASGNDDLPVERLTALGAHLRDALAAVPGSAVVDRDRTLQAQRQLDSTGDARPDPDALRSVAAAQRVLLPKLVMEADRWHVAAELHAGDAPPQVLEGPVAADPASALRAWLAQPAVASALGIAGNAVDLRIPASSSALDAYGAGLRAYTRGELPTALQQLQRATRQAPDHAAAWLALAGTALAIGEQDLAHDALEQGRAALGPDAPPARQRRFAAELALLDGEAPKAVAAWRSLLQATPDDTFAELNLARAQGAGGDFTAAVAGLQALSGRDGNDPRVWYELGKFSILSGDARRAVDDYLVRALVLFKRSGNRFGEAETLNALGIGYGRLGLTADAAEQYRDAAELRRAIGNRRGVATSLRNLANVESLTGQFDQAAQHLAEARTVHAELGDRDGLAAVDNELGLLAEEQGDYRGALAAYRRALQGWQRLGDPHGIAQALNNIGFANYQLGDYDDAQVYWQQAADAYAQLGSATGRIRTAQNLGLLAATRGQWRRARELLTTSLEDARQQQMVEEAAVSHRNLAELELWQGHLAASIEQARQAGELFRQREDLRGISDAGLLHARALLAAHADAQAATLLDGLQPALAEASTEQRAIAQLLRARLAERAGRDADDALRDAATLARDSGVRALQLQIALHQAGNDSGDGTQLGEAIDSLGHAGLRLAWIESRMRRALATNRPDAALDAFDEALPLLREGDYLRGHQLHLLAAAAYDAAGDATRAAAAHASAQQALAALREGLPDGLVAGFDQATTAAGPVATTEPPTP